MEVVQKRNWMKRFDLDNLYKEFPGCVIEVNIKKWLNAYCPDTESGGTLGTFWRLPRKDAKALNVTPRCITIHKLMPNYAKAAVFLHELKHFFDWKDGRLTEGIEEENEEYRAHMYAAKRILEMQDGDSAWMIYTTALGWKAGISGAVYRKVGNRLLSTATFRKLRKLSQF